MNRFVRWTGLIAVALIAAVGMPGCGPSNPDSLSFRITGYYTSSYSEAAGCSVSSPTAITGGSGTASELAATPCFFVEFTNNLEGTSATSPNIALGNIVLEKVQAVAKIRGTNIFLPTTTVLSSTEISAGGKLYFGMPVISDEQLTALVSNEFSLPSYPFEIDFAYTGFGRYAGSEYRASGDFTLVVTGLFPPTEGM